MWEGGKFFEEANRKIYNKYKANLSRFEHAYAQHDLLKKMGKKLLLNVRSVLLAFWNSYHFPLTHLSVDIMLVLVPFTTRMTGFYRRRYSKPWSPTTKKWTRLILTITSHIAMVTRMSRLFELFGFTDYV